MSDNNSIAAVGARGVQPGNVSELFAFCNAVASSGLAPKGMNTPEKVLVAVQTGMEVGMTPMRALSSVVVINGVPSWKGDAARALIQESGKADGPIHVEYEGEGDRYTCIVWTRRYGEVVRGQFSVGDAKRAGLWGKSGPWTQYPDRMLMYRALGFLGRDHFADVLFGLRVQEEQQDIPEPRAAEVVEQAEDPLLAEAVPFDNNRTVVGGDHAIGEEGGYVDEHEQQRDELFAAMHRALEKSDDEPVRDEWLSVVQERLGELEPMEQAAFLAEHIPAGLESATTEQLEHVAGLLES